ncbi:MAG: adenylate/guanylate cyclase domain-containing protein, partial [Thermoanaerobaculia bacterium]
MELKALFPNLLLNLLKKNKIENLKNREFEKKGTICFADISGFTPLSEALMKIGPEGSEILGSILNFYYENIIKIIKKYKGDVLSFAGDALNVYFEREEEAISSSIEIQNFFKEKKEAKTPAGIFPISIKIGIATGDLKFYILKEEGFFNPVFEGEAIDKAAEAEHHSKSGEIVLFRDGKFLNIRAEFVQPEDYKKNNNFVGAEFIQSDFLIDTLHPFFKEVFLKEQTKFLNEHKYCVIIFINLNKGILKEIYKETAKILKKYQGFFLKVDCGDKGDKFLILFGIPFQIEEPLIKAYDFLIEFKKMAKEENFSFKAGLNYAKIFAGFLGSDERCEYTVLGDGVNLAARLMQIAGEGEVLSLKDVSEKAEEFIFSPKPPVQLKGKTGLFTLQELSGRKTFKPDISFFYGRKKELENFKENFEKNNFFLIYGEQGTGKTYFTTYFLDNFIRKPTIYINCTFAEKEIPYNAIKKFLNLYFYYKKKDLREIFKIFIEEKNLPVFLNLFLDENLREPDLDPEVKKGIIFKGISEILKKEIKEEIIIFI